MVLASRSLKSDSSAPGMVSDRELLRRYLRGDEVAFAAVVERHAGLVMGVCQQILRQAQDAEDAFQAVFLVLAKKAATLESHPSLIGWLHQTARRTALKLRTQAVRRRLLEQKTGERQEAVKREAQQAAASAGASLHEMSSIIDEELDRLPAELREVILLRQVQDLSRDEIASLLGVTVAQVKCRLERGRERLRVRLLRRGITLSAAAMAGWLSTGTAQAATSGGLMATTAHASAAFAAGKLAAGTVSVAVLSLAQEMLKVMGMHKLVMTGGCLLSLITASMLVYGSLRDDPQRFQRGLCGQVVELRQDASTTSITIVVEGFETLLNLDVEPEVQVWTAFQADKLDSVRAGQRVSLRLAADHRTVREIHVEGRRGEGIIRNVSPNGTLTLQADDDDDSAKDETVRVAPDAILRIGQLSATLEDFHPGMEVPLEFGPDGATVNAIEVEASQGSLVDGKIAALDAKSGVIHLQRDSGVSDGSPPGGYQVTPRTLMLLDGRPAEISELRPDAVIRMRLSADGRSVRALHAQTPSGD
jgi:RNA polymerase sigma factor (sigma-70 family)